jgi:hypothetical protein
MRTFILSLLTAITINVSLSQVHIELPISRIDASGETDTVYFGVDTRATYCIDSSLGEFEIWWQACGLVPCLAFVDVRTGAGACLGTGTPIDLRPYYRTTQVDTYKLKFDGTYPVVFHWLPIIASYYGAMTFMNNRDTGAASIKINMLAQDSFVITPQQSSFSWYIRAESPIQPTAVQSGDGHVPRSPSLSHNYPNPFNPVTTIQYSLPHEAHITLGIYNVLGQLVAILTDGLQTAGHKQIDWNATSFPSGVYFYRLQAGSYSETKTLVLLR